MFPFISLVESILQQLLFPPEFSSMFSDDFRGNRSCCRILSTNEINGNVGKGQMKLRPKMERDRLQILRLKLSELSEFKQINKLPYSAEGLNPLPFIDDTLSLRGNPSTFEKKLLDNIVPMKCRINTKRNA